jgi:hypothetical protein
MNRFGGDYSGAPGGGGQYPYGGMNMGMMGMPPMGSPMGYNVSRVDGVATTSILPKSWHS